MILFDLTHTAHSQARTGIQRQARAIFLSAQRQAAIAPICFDPYASAWRPLDPAEQLCASSEPVPTQRRRAAWRTSRKLRSWFQRVTRTIEPLPAGDAFACLEIFSPRVAEKLPEVFAKVRGPRVAFFFDTIPLTHPEFTPAKTVARFPAYLQELLQFDGIAANSRYTADSLLGYWRWLGCTKVPEVTVLPLGVERLPVASVATPQNTMPQVLCVGSIEGRKNHLALLAAAESLWANNLRFELRLIGLPRPETAAAALREIQRLRSAGRPLRFDGVVDDRTLATAWDDCSFSVYPSMIEGFGLPVVESLARGKPCICAAVGATAELLPGGGCIGVANPDAAGLAQALRRLLTDAAELRRLTAEARARPVPTWDACTQHLLTWIEELRAKIGHR